MHIILDVCVGILYGFYLVYDTQLIMGGKSYEISMDDYIFGKISLILAAVMLYIDIIQLFLEILKLLNRLNQK